MKSDQTNPQFYSAETPSLTRPPVPPLSILLAEDNVKIREAVRRSLSLAQHEVACASTGSEAVKLLAKQRFDLLITDIFMPDMDGLELINIIAKAIPSLRILAISGGSKFHPADLSLNTSLYFGAHEILVKPFGHPELLDAIGRLMAFNHAPGHLRDSNAGKGGGCD